MIWAEPSLGYLSSIGSSKTNFKQADQICQDFLKFLLLNPRISMPNGLEVIEFGDGFTAFLFAEMFVARPLTVDDVFTS